jgi:hypothetical protein
MNGAYGNATYGVVWDAWRIWICGLRGCGMHGAFGNAPYGFKIKSASSNALDKKLRAGDADPGPLIRRRRREVALVDTIRQCSFLFMTLNLRLTYDFERFFYPN